MAAAAFAAYAGYAGWGFWATFAAIAVGTAIDAYLFAPAGSQYEGPRLHDTKVITSTYGNPIPLLYGPENRISGNVIWSTGLIETKHEEEEGGKGGGGSTSTTYTYRMSLAVAICGREMPENFIKRIWMNNKLIYENGTFDVMEGITMYTGAADQMPDPVMESYLGAGLVPAYRHTAYCVIEDLQLADFGNRMPNIEFEIFADEEISVGGIVADLCSRGGVDNPSCAHLTDLVRGYAVTRNGPIVGHLSPLGAAYSFDAAEQGGSLRFMKKGRSLKGTMPIGQTGCVSPGSKAVEPIIFKTMSDLNMPREVVVTYQDAELDYQSNSQRAFREEGTALNRVTMELPITLTPDHARQIADRILWEAWTARYGATLRTDDTWVKRGAGDLMGIPAAGEILPYKITRSTRGVNGINEWELTRDDPFVYQSFAEAVNGRIPVNSLRSPGETRLVLMDCPILRNQDDSTGFYWAVTGESEFWRGAEVFRSSDEGASYQSMSRVGVRTVIGNSVYALQDGPTEFWDRGNTVTVILDFEDDILESVDEESVLRGNNAFWLGGADGQNGEIIQFATATLVGPKTYVLSDLLRGRLGTEANAGIHGNNEVFVLLQLSFLGRSDYGPGDFDRERLYKPVSLLTAIADTDAQEFTNTGAGRKPLSPVHVKGVRDGSNNLTVTFIRRTRYRVPGLGRGPVPLGEESERYEIDIYDGVDVVRTITATTPTFSYTAAEQTSDGLTPGDFVDMRIYQISADRGRGFPATASV